MLAEFLESGNYWNMRKTSFLPCRKSVEILWLGRGSQMLRIYCEAVMEEVPAGKCRSSSGRRNRGDAEAFYSPCGCLLGYWISTNPLKSSFVVFWSFAVKRYASILIESASVISIPSDGGLFVLFLTVMIDIECEDDWLALPAFPCTACASWLRS